MHFSILQVAPVWHPMLQPPFLQLRMVHVAPAAHSMRQPVPQLSMVQVDPFAQFWTVHPPATQSVMAQVASCPHVLMVQPPWVQVP